ncbi:efflux RND transporter permease subunit [Paraburkholderia elongata]|uniref:efflux RND transporter permease subunit n=1 Tax=Paraburkholderia elongata TaxID=2675747 RepID=UPI002E2D26AE|nr:efflux RND transporter permease subunit [Paraburkholderia elongata]
MNFLQTTINQIFSVNRQDRFDLRATRTGPIPQAINRSVVTVENSAHGNHRRYIRARASRRSDEQSSRRWKDPEGSGHLDVFVRLTDPTRLTVEQLNQIPVMASGWVALSDVVDVRMVTGPNVIRHLNGLRTIEILATPTATLGHVISASKKALATLPLPVGYEVKFGGLYPQLEGAALNVGVAAVVALALMLGILTLQFDGLLVPGLLLLQMPLAFSGGGQKAT